MNIHLTNVKKRGGGLLLAILRFNKEITVGDYIG